jgi:hypothetical protein
VEEPDVVGCPAAPWEERGLGGRGGGEAGGGRSAMAATAASTLRSNSSAVMVREERSRFSMNWIAPIF